LPLVAAFPHAVGAIGPLELSEYLGIAVIYLALAVTAPLRASRQIEVPA
jgi:hypothetical protein